MINKDVWGEIILDFQNKELPSIIKRELKISLAIPIKRAVTIIGPRRSGKTYYLLSLIKTLLEKGTAKKRILYINFENIKLVGATVSDLKNLLEVFYEIYPDNKKEPCWFFFDEIQNIAGWEIFVRYILDEEKAQVFLSGSSSKLLSSEIATQLRGRTLSYLFLPFSFSEYLRAKDITFDKYLPSARKAGIINSFYNYLASGGYPEVIFFPQEKDRLINEIIETTIQLDLIERHKVRNTKVIKMMFKALVSSQMFSVHKFYNFLKSLRIRVSKNSLYNFLDYFTEAFIFFPLKRFSYSLRNIEQSLPKIYSVDNALVDNIVGDDRGKKFENLVFLSMLQKEFKLNKEIFYYHFLSGEVDFIIRKGNRTLFLIQASYDIDDYQTEERETKSLIRASEELNCRNLLVITKGKEEEKKVKGKRIKLIPLWKWLLEKKINV
jgi:predicted AAA+ superfamily ATPase